MLRCNVCGKSEEETQINIHSAINLPVSYCYCVDCDKMGFITAWEFIKYIASNDPKHKEMIIEDFDFIRDNAKKILNNRQAFE